MHKIEIGTEIVKQYPATIDEMTSKQFVEFSALVFMYQSQQISFSEFSIKLTYQLLNMKRRVNISNHPDANIIAENINSLSKLNEAFFEKKIINKKSVKVIRLDFVRNLIPKVNINTQWYYGPGDALTNTEFGEYVSALNAYLDFSKTGKEEDLDWMIASLYRPECKLRKKHNLEDTRISFEKHRVQHLAAVLTKIPFAQKYAIYLWFSACQKFIVTNKQLELSGDITVDLSVLFKQESTGEKGIGMAGVIYSLAETNVFGDAEKTAKQNMYDVFLRMLQTYLQAKKMQKDAKNR
ncbi:hypothetical protein [Tenacibaculum soleae]|uniref:hypothetical protein n=1 Tax=Tenacibaculum soleae TaxID=447689 RepID=UPI00230015AB|nr:hypothetical protein [Tenacibaculum soleae]